MSYSRIGTICACPETFLSEGQLYTYTVPARFLGRELTHIPGQVSSALWAYETLGAMPNTFYTMRPLRPWRMSTMHRSDADTTSAQQKVS